MVVTAIAGVLGAVAIPRFVGARKTSTKKTRDKNNKDEQNNEKECYADLKKK